MPPIRFRIKTIMVAIAIVAVYMGIAIGMLRSNPNLPRGLLPCFVLPLPIAFLSSRFVRPFLRRYFDRGQSTDREAGTRSKRGVEESVG
jgi:formate-dependent nitrite reductase membrane component NrfD